jgi:AraC family transcriptional regulator, regulatory protein of adaptative response / methylated-DNA-[protein]-cysteine methyltransferase
MNVQPMDYEQLSEDYARIEQAICYLDEHAKDQPSLKDVADYLGLSEYHFQRLFSRWAGISPKRFLQYVTKEHAKQLLDQSGSVLTATYEAGLSSTGRLHDLFVVCEAMTPGEYKQGGAGLTITYGYHPGLFGECQIAATQRGVCSLQFIEAGNRQSALDVLQARWPNAAFQEDAQSTWPMMRQVFALFEGTPVTPLHLHLQGTNFQIKVWEALLSIPAGSAVTYEDIASAVQKPKAMRAVGQAVAHNPVAVLIPCHRVLRKIGDFGGYRWGVPRKKALLAWEAAHPGSAQQV